MSARSIAGITCGLWAIFSLVIVSTCALVGAVLLPATAAIVGQSAEFAFGTMPDTAPQVADLARSAFRDDVASFSEGLVESIVTSSDLYAEAMSALGSSSKAERTLGSPILGEDLVNVRAYQHSPWGARADFTVLIRGPQATGYLTVVAHKDLLSIHLDFNGVHSVSSAEWVIDRLLLAFPDQSEVIDLMSEGS